MQAGSNYAKIDSKPAPQFIVEVFMKHAYIRIAAFLLIFGSVIFPATALKLLPGDYPLEWRIPEPYEDPSWSRIAVIDLSPMTSDDRQTFAGLRSDNPYWGAERTYTVIVDESKGTGTGYDVAYLAGTASKGSLVDLKDVMRLALAKSSDHSEANVVLASLSDGSQPLIDLGLYSLLFSPTNKAAVDLSVHFATDGAEKRLPMSADLSLRGGWYGKIKSDTGDLTVRAIDKTANGAYDDKVSTKSSGDAVVVLKSLSYPVPICLPCNVLYQGKAVSYAGNLYSLSVNGGGDKLSVKNYTDTVGQAKFDVRDGQKKPVKWFQVEASNKMSKLCCAPGEGLITLPTGEYSCAVTIWPKSYSPTDEGFFGIVFEPMRPIKVKKGKIARPKVGGPIKIEIEPGFDVISASPGQEKYIELAFAMRGGRLAGFLGDRSLTVNIRDSANRLISSVQTIVAWGGSCGYLLKAPETAGIYKIGVSFDLRPYQEPISVYKKLIVKESA